MWFRDPWRRFPTGMPLMYWENCISIEAKPNLHAGTCTPHPTDHWARANRDGSPHEDEPRSTRSASSNSGVSESQMILGIQFLSGGTLGPTLGEIFYEPIRC